MTFRVELSIPAVRDHTFPVISGFVLLARQQVIDLTLHGPTGPDPDDATANTLLAVIDGVPVAYDLLDGVPDDLAERAGRVAVYFKRSYRAGMPANVYPLGLNYPVTVPHPFFRRSWRERVRPSQRVESFECLPGRGNGVVFFARTWPGQEAINDHRAACVSALRAAFGARFTGGLDNLPNQRTYVQLMRQSAIGVATTGLHESTGWKLAEYVAASKAVVTSPLLFTAPGFTEGDHYLPFRSPDELIEQVDGLLSDRRRLLAMQAANWSYYLTALRPDRLVWRSVTLALGAPDTTAAHHRQAAGSSR